MFLARRWGDSDYYYMTFEHAPNIFSLHDVPHFGPFISDLVKDSPIYFVTGT